MLFILGTIAMGIGFPLVLFGLICYLMYLLTRRVNIWLAGLMGHIAYKRGKKKGMEEAKKEMESRCPCISENN